MNLRAKKSHWSKEYEHTTLWNLVENEMKVDYHQGQLEAAESRLNSLKNIVTNLIEVLLKSRRLDVRELETILNMREGSIEVE